MKHYAEGARWYDLISTGLPGDVSFYLKEAKRAKGRVLELACGTGRIYLELLEAGVDAYGIDLSPSMLRVLRQKAKARRLEPKVKKADMRTFRYPFKFDLIIIPFNAFLHLETREGQKKCLTSIRCHLKRGGRLVLDIFDPRVDYLAAIERTTTSTVADPKSGRKTYMENFSRYDLPGQHIYSYHRLIKPPEGLPKEKIEFTLTYIFPREFMNLLELCGFKKWELYGGFGYGPYKKHGQSLVWIAHK
jgi:SAM-dependent methyltransferase